LWRRPTAAWIAISGNYTAPRISKTILHQEYQFKIPQEKCKFKSNSNKDVGPTKVRVFYMLLLFFYHARHVYFLPDFLALSCCCCSLAVFHSLNRLPRGSKKKKAEKFVLSVSQSVIFSYSSLFSPVFFAVLCAVFYYRCACVTCDPKVMLKSRCNEKQKGIPFGVPQMCRRIKKKRQ